MGSKRTSRRELLKGGAALAGGLTLGDIASLQAQAHDHPPTPGSQNASPMILGSKELTEYGQRSKYVTSVRIQHPPGGRPSPDLFGKQFHIASPLQDSVGVITPTESCNGVATWNILPNTSGEGLPPMGCWTRTEVTYLERWPYSTNSLLPWIIGYAFSGPGVGG